MKILFFGDYSNVHASLASELKKRGHDVTVISDGGRYMDTEKDILIDRRPGIQGTFKYLFDLARLFPTIKGFDVVQVINPHFLDLKPDKIKFFFKRLKKNNRSIFLTLAGDDYHFVNACLNSNMFRFSEFCVGQTPTEFERISHRGQLWTQPVCRDYALYLYDNLDGAMSLLPEYDMASRSSLGDRLAFTNLPIDLSAYNYNPLVETKKIRFFIGIREGMKIQKGTGMLLDMCRNIERKYPELCEVECVSNLPLKEYLGRMSDSHIVLDQYYSYSPGMNALQAMALGKIAGTGGQPEYYDYINWQEHPVIPLSPLRSIKEWEDYLLKLMQNPAKMREMSLQGRKLVERNNDIRLVADRFEKHWNNILNK
ncbi:MAG: hypothetical protein K2H76_00425 [Muribaculaceae bacterium]|nr:hypothetical protein [Muribaculaceae bacterium]MDE6028490.1 hypothetical protein [Muribaculaceae bacterium]